MSYVFTKEDYSKSCVELIEILRNIISKEELKKIPKDKILTYIKYQDKKYNYKYNRELSFKEQNISQLTKALFANLYIDYWATDEEKSDIQLNDSKNMYELELEKKKNYPVDNIFKTNRTSREQEKYLMVIDQKENLIKKILKKIKNIFKNKNL